MPPKPKFTRDEIVSTALALVAEKGADALTAKALGEALGSSARPIFTVFDSMAEVRTAVREAAMARFDDYATHALPDMPLFKQVGMQMVHFSVREPKLYQLLFMREQPQGEGFDSLFAALGDTAGLCIRAIEQDYNLSPCAAQQLFETVWIYTFGVGALCATGMCRFTELQLSEMLSAQFQAAFAYVKGKEK